MAQQRQYPITLDERRLSTNRRFGPAIGKVG